jgi:hypothetical protein
MTNTFKKVIKTVLASVVMAAAVASPVLAAPILYVDDNAGNLGTVDVATGAVTMIGNTGLFLVDIAFDPSGNLFGITFNSLYQINKTSGAATLVGSFGPTLNSLVFGSDGTLYAANNGLYQLNTSTGAATLIGNGGYAYNSSGDLAFANGNLFLTSSGGDDLVSLNVANGVGALVGGIGFSAVYGLASNDGINLFGLSGTQILGINTATGAGTLLGNYGGQGLSAANGSAFFAEAGAAVPEPATAALFGLAAFGIACVRRRSKGLKA